MPPRAAPRAVGGAGPGTRVAPTRWRAEVEGYLAAVRAVGCRAGSSPSISPHAGLRYSGPVAAHGYALLRGRPVTTVVLVGPSHRVAVRRLRGVRDGRVRDAARPRSGGRGAGGRAARGGRRASCDDAAPAPGRALARDAAAVPAAPGAGAAHRARADGQPVAREVDALAAALGARPRAAGRAARGLERPQPLPSRAAWRTRLDAQVVGDVERFDRRRPDGPARERARARLRRRARWWR